MKRSQAWKHLERVAAAALPGGERIIEKGESVPDAVGEGWVAEAKLRKSFLHHSLYRTERAKRRKTLGGRRFVLVTRESGREALAVIALSDFAEIVQRIPCRNGCSCHHKGEEHILPGLGAEDTTGGK